MAINKNHEFEELDGIKCGIVEKNVSQERATFLKILLEQNNFTVVVIPSPSPKAVATVAKHDGEENNEPVAIVSSTFTVGVTDYTFNAINAIFGRLLKTTDGHIVTLAYWQQKENIADDEVPYFENEK